MCYCKGMLITLDDILDVGPCYTRDEIERIAAGRTEIQLVDILDEPILEEDRIWLVLHLVAWHDVKIVVRFAQWCADRIADVIEAEAAAQAAADAATYAARESKSSAYAADYAAECAYCAGVTRAEQITWLKKELKNA